MRFITFLLLLCLILATNLKGQIGTEFWFAPPNVSLNHDSDSDPLLFHITAHQDADVEILRATDNTLIHSFFLSAKQTEEVQLDLYLTVPQIETIEIAVGNPDFIQETGILIRSSSGEISAYYEMKGRNYNTDIIALKAQNALGSDFWVSTQRKFYNETNDAFSGFAVIATEDNTEVNVYPNGNNLANHGTASFSVTLDKGETFAMRANSQHEDDHIFGVRVTTTDPLKKIAITIYDDSMRMRGGGSWDIFADQIIPVELTGLEYINMKGEVEDLGTNANDGEAVFITPTQDFTDIYIDGVKMDSNLMAGDYAEFLITNYSTHIRATKPVYVNQVTGYANIFHSDPNNRDTRELGGAILPPIDKCTGSHSVTVKRTPAPSVFRYTHTLMVRNDTLTGSPTRNKAIHNFTYSIQGGAQNVSINPSHFTYIMDSAFAVFDRYKALGAAYYESTIDGDVITIENPISRFHMGVLQGAHTRGGKYGYFSDFAASDASAGIGGFTQGNAGTYCNLNPIKMVAGGGTSYKWYAPYDPTLNESLDYDTIPDPYFYPDTSGIYYFNVLVTGECQSKDTLNIEIFVLESTSTSFSFSSDEGCSPFAPTLTNLSDTTVGIYQVWGVKTAVGNDYEINQDSMPRTFDLLLPENHTDTIQKHTIELIVTDQYYACPSRRTKEIKVLPQIDAGFEADDTIGCHPLFVKFDNFSTGHLDSTSYLWDFGDNSQSFDSLPSKNYSNYSLDDTTFIATLVTESPFGCKDTAQQSITVHPRIRVNVAADTTTACSPLISTLNPMSSVGVDTLWWNIDYFYDDSTFKTTTVAPITLTHYDTSTAAGPDSLYVQLIGSNRKGCRDTATTRMLITYPDVIADFTVDQSVVCDSIPILFTNKSVGYQLFYEWDFGNNTFSQDSSGQSYTKVFFNRFVDELLATDTTYNVRLNATSGYFCKASMDTTITVHPYIRADFGLSYDNNCSPLASIITNTSIGTQTDRWDFGTGTLVINNSGTINRNFINPYSDKDTTIGIKLVVNNSDGCMDSITRPLLLFPQVIADFEFTTDSIGCAPLNLGLQNNSTGGSLTYTWDFGDNSSSTTNSANLSKLFNNVTGVDTTYIVQLSARNLLGCDSVLTRPVEVFAFVDAEFSLPVVDSCSPFTIRPDNLSSIGASVFDWDFGNSNTSADFEPIVPTYIKQDELVGNYDVRLIASSASDPAHLACADTHIVPIIVYPELETEFLMSDTINCQPLISTITNNTNIIPNTSFAWYIGDNFYSTDNNPPDLTQYNYRDYDTNFTVKLFGRSEYNCRDTATQNIHIFSNIDAFFSFAPSAICSADSFQVDQTYTSGGISYRHWDFAGEDTSNITTNRFYHIFDNTIGSSPLEKEISLTVFNTHNCSSTWRDTITVYPQVTADFDPDFNAICYPHNTVFANNSNNAHQAYWVFGDGSSSIDTEPIHLYNNFDPAVDKTYDIKLTSTSNYNCFDTITKQITIYAKPDADFYIPISVACPPFTAEMKDNSQGAGLVYDWDFAGEETSTLSNPSHTFSNSTSAIEEKPITLIVNSEENCSDTLVKTVSVFPDVNVDFEYTINEGCSPLEVTFTGDTSNVLQMLWYIDGKAFSTIKDPTQRFVNETPGNKIHDIKFEAWSLYECSADTTKKITVYPTPIAEFIPSPLPADYGTEADQTPITFSNETVFPESWSYEWNYGDGTIDNQSASDFVYNYGEFFWGATENENNIPVQMVAWNTDNAECRDTVFHNVIIYPPLPQIDLAEDVHGCQPFTFDFSATTKYIDETDYRWEFGVEGDTSIEASPTHTFTEAGIYTVKLIVRGAGGTNWDYKIVTVDPKPVADFMFNDSVVFDSSQTKGYDWINFYNQSSYANKFYWYFDSESNFGGASDSEERDPSWYYNDVGEYYVGLIAESGIGCLDTLIHPTSIKVQTEGFVKYPTAFLVSPDGPSDEYDTQNRNKYVFYPLSSGVDEYQLEVYNRWGARVFNSKKVNRGWNGYIDGAPAKQDVYIWRARGRYSNGQPFDMSGDVTLIHGRDEIAP